jgi:hypothetical protein
MLRTVDWALSRPDRFVEGTMAAHDHVPSGSERRRALRMPVRGVAVFYGEDGAICGTIENLSRSGALVNVDGPRSASGGRSTTRCAPRSRRRSRRRCARRSDGRSW